MRVALLAAFLAAAPYCRPLWASTVRPGSGESGRPAHLSPAPESEAPPESEKAGLPTGPDEGAATAEPGALDAALVLDREGMQAGDIRDKVIEWRKGKEHEIVRSVMSLSSIPSVASDAGSMAKKMTALARLYESGGFSNVRLLASEGSPPAVYGEMLVPGASKTIVLYSHADVQPPGDLSRWATPPFEPVLRDNSLERGGKIIDVDPAKPLDPDWVVYGRGVADDMHGVQTGLRAVEALRALAIELSVNVKVFIEGEEEAGSPHMRQMLEKHKDLLKSDFWLFLDGPAHPTGRAQAVFGARGFQGLNLTFYGALNDLHSGHYGGWLKNPIEIKNRLLQSLGTAGDVKIAGFYDQVRPISPAEKEALDRLPNLDLELRRQMGITQLETGEGTREARHLRPALNLRGEQAGKVGKESVNSIPSQAVVSIDFRLVPDQSPQRIQELVERHIQGQDFVIVRTDAEAEAARKGLLERLLRDPNVRLPNIVKVEWGAGSYASQRTAMDFPLSRAVTRIAEETVGPIVSLVTQGGSFPVRIIWEVLDNVPLIMISAANHDDNQHAPNENLRLGSLWVGIELVAVLLALLGKRWA